MKRIVVLVLIIASAAMFIFVLRMPTGSVRRFFPNQGSVQPGSPAPKPTKAMARNTANERKPAARRTTDGHSPEQGGSPAASSAVPTSPKLNARARSVPGRHSNAERSQEIMWSISSDSAALYSTNSSSGTVLQILKKGEVVASNMELLAPGGRWILVESPNQDTSGFVRGDTVVRKHPEEPIGQ